MIKNSSERDDRNIFILFLGLLIVGFFFRIKLSPYFTFELDLNTFRAWSDTLAANGLGKFYDSTWSDYMPGYMYILLVLNKIQAAFPNLDYHVLYKMPANLADVLNALIICWMLKDYFNTRIAIFSSLVYYFNIALIANSTFWGQMESVHLLPILLSITLCMKGYYSVPVIIATVSAMIKPQSYVLLPFIFLISARSDFQKSEVVIPYKALVIKSIIGILLIVLTVTLISMPFTWDKHYAQGYMHGIFNTFIFIKERFLASYDQYQFTSINAFNFWALTTGMWVNDQQTFGITFQKWGIGIFILLFLVITLKYIYSEIIKPLRSGRLISNSTNNSHHENYYLNSVFSIMLVFFILFMFATRAHERHLYTALALMTLIVYRAPIYMFCYIVVSVIYLLNLFYSYLYLYPFGGFNTASFTPYIGFLVIIEILILLLLFVSFIKGKSIIDKSFRIPFQLIKNYLKNLVRKYKITSEQTASLKLNLRFKSIETLVLILFIISLAVKIYDVRKPDKYYFDEIYFAFTANEMAQWHQAGWRYVPGAPKGVAYEWTHPPLGKEITAIGIKIFGNNPTGWRIFQVLFGAAGTIIIYFLATELFRNKLVGLFASVLYTFESLTFVLSRISMVDIYLVTFIQLSVLFLIRFFNYNNIKTLAASGLFIGCAISVKWNGIFGLFFLFIVTLIYATYSGYRLKIPLPIPGFEEIKNPLIFTLIFLVILPLFVYFLTYIPFLFTGNSFHDLLVLQKSMYYYHKNLRATHPYSSQWWQWPLMLKPVFLYLKPIGNKASFIYAMGNPFIWWTGSLFTIAGLIYSLIRRNFGLLLCVLGLLAFWIPWTVSPRALTFIYHFFPCVYFMLLITAYFLSILWKRAGYFRYLVCIYLLAAVVAFCYFYPITSGYPIGKKNIDSYMWIKSWR